MSNNKLQTSRIDECEKSRHSRENGNPDVVPAKAGSQQRKKLGSCFHRKPWIPASAGMTGSTLF
jgi:hypothetical protein